MPYPQGEGRRTTGKHNIIAPKAHFREVGSGYCARIFACPGIEVVYIYEELCKKKVVSVHFEGFSCALLDIMLRAARKYFSHLVHVTAEL